jgi:hypothetical protein
VLPATSASQARSRAQRNQKKGIGAIQRANAQDSRLIHKGM